MTNRLLLFLQIRTRFVVAQRLLGAVAGLFFILPDVLASSGSEHRNARSELSLTDAWRFHQGPLVSANTVAYDDSTWEVVALPHTWNARDGQDGGSYFQGDGWYRRSFQVPAGWAGKQVFLQFDGANRQAEVFLNGHRLGLHRGGYARFRFDATSVLKLAGPNVLAVRVNNAVKDNMIPVTGDFTFFGGLYRAVSLIATDPVHIDLLDHASPGVYVQQQRISSDIAELEVRVRLANDSAAITTATVRTTIVAADGQVVQVVEGSTDLEASARAGVFRRIVLTQPHLWDAQADPYLYQVKTEVLVGGVVRDEVSIPMGLRFYSVDPARGFFLNGRYRDLRGVNRHQDRLNKGYAISDGDEREDFALIEEMGATMIRQSHYQQSQLWNDLGDTRGLVMWAEIPYVYDVLDNRSLFENAKQQLRELIRQNHHHPSILFWGIGNEIFVRNTATTPSDASDRLLRELAIVARDEDPSRLSVYASNGSVGEARAGTADVVGFNHYYGWYHHTPDDFADWVDSQHLARPDLCMGMSEYGAGANIEQHEDPAKRPVASGPWHPEEWQTVFHETHWQTMANRPWLWCKLVWCMFDLAADGRNEGGTPGRNDKGIVSADRQTKKDSFYWYKANWSSEPVLYITSRRFVARANPIGPVKIYSNAATVELRVNGISLGSRTSSNRIFLWPEVVLNQGRNLIEARTKVGGRELADSCEWTYERTESPVVKD